MPMAQDHRRDADGREEVMRLSGQRLIPILAIGDEVLADSSYIIRELRRRFSRTGSNG